MVFKMKTYCPSCLHEKIVVFHSLKGVPVHSVKNINSKKEALEFPKGDIQLGFCRNCGFITNLAFNPSLIAYSEECEESQGFSPTFQKILRNNVNELIEKYNLREKNIIEIGCGKGEFLHLICKLGKNRGIGFDPAYNPLRDSENGKNNVLFIKEYFSEAFSGVHGDLICCRMTLEHIPETHAFLSMVRRSIGERFDTIAFFQVPDMTRVLKDCAFEDIYYEHCSYFSPGSLAGLFRRCGFQIIDLRRVYDDQYIVLEAKPATKEDLNPSMVLENDLETMTEHVQFFSKKYDEIIKQWTEKVRGPAWNEKRIVLWGSGSKAVAFLNGLKINNEIKYIVDINPNRQGTFMAGTGQEIVSPDFLKEYLPEIVIIMNPIYRQEIQSYIHQMGINPKILDLGEKA